MTELLKKSPELSTKETSTEKDTMITKYPKLSKEFFLLVNAWDTLRSPDTIKSLNFKWQYLSSHDMKYLNDCKNIEEIKLDNIKTLEWMDFTKYEKIKSISVQSLDIKEFRQIKDTITWLEQLAKLAKKNYRKVQEYEGQKLTMVDTTFNSRSLPNDAKVNGQLLWTTVWWTTSKNADFKVDGNFTSTDGTATNGTGE